MAATAARDWTTNQALPLWEGAGRDPHGGFYEKLTLQGRPETGAVRRLRVQARQMYVYCHADMLGWRPGGAEVAARALDRLLAITGPDAGGEGWPHLLTPDGGVHDPRRDLYDHAFMLLALAWLHRAGDTRALTLAEQTFAFVERRLAHPAGGWREGDPDTAPRRQNPHMHMFEAMMALHAATGDDRWLQPARRILNLFRTRFLEPQTATLREYFTDDWLLAHGASGRLVEPGHHMEWVWLLRVFEQETAENCGSFSDALYEYALSAGADPATGFLFDAVDAEAGPLRRSRRLWPQTELVKAHYARALTGRPGALAAGRAALAALKAHYLDPAHPGGWIDMFDENALPAVADIPASTFYHLFCAIAYAHEADATLAGKPG
ncbi:MAG: AGE family epimerase/isomerase [Maricaulaceae bacterium]|nr:AGE family epimerase/isomerase [Maricaulaceae bacterium]